MAKIKKIRFENILGITELNLEPGKVNILRGPNGAGKTSILECIGLACTNKGKRTELIRHGEEEASLYIKLDTNEEIERVLKNTGRNNLKIRKENEGLPQRESYLRRLIRGEIFNPIDWFNKSDREQYESLLSIIDIKWSKEDIINWFGRLENNIPYDSSHIISILKLTEQLYYKNREQVNREIKHLETTVLGLENELPPYYNGDDYRHKSITEHYKKVALGENKNKLIDENKKELERVKDSLEKSYVEEDREVLKIQGEFSKGEGEILNCILENNGLIEVRKRELATLDERLKKEYLILDEEYKRELNILIKKYENLREEKKEEYKEKGALLKERVEISKERVLKKEEELKHLRASKEKEEGSVRTSFEKLREEKKAFINDLENVINISKYEDVNTLRKEAENLVYMQSFLKDFDKIIEIKEGVLKEKEQYSKELTRKIELARKLPKELIKKAKMPVKGLAIDDKGDFRIDGKLINGLSDGEKLKLAINVAKAECGELEIICIDRFECLDERAKKYLYKEIENDDFQYFITEVSTTESGKLEIEKRGSING